MDQLGISFTKLLIGLYNNPYVEVCLIVVLAAITNYLGHLFFTKIEATIEPREDLKFTKIFIKAAKSPMHCLIIVIAALLIFEILSKSYKFLASKQFVAIETSLLLITLLWLIIEIINEFEIFWIKNAGALDKKFDKTSISAASKIMRISACVIVGLILLDANGISISGILAFGGVSGIAVGFASRDMLANFFGTLMIYLDKPFKIGDWVKIPEKGIEGTIESIGMRCTIIKSLERRPIYIP
ncbi:MAG: mechanosensitive ion channel family protein, partial [Alphaproteobacteria bacterium]